jgi:hypothetical protein
MRRVIERWGHEAVDKHFGVLQGMGNATWSKVRWLAMRHEVEVAVVMVRTAIFWRVTHPFPGRNTSTLTPTGADFDYIRGQEQQGNTMGITTTRDLLATEFDVGDHGWLVLASKNL